MEISPHKACILPVIITLCLFFAWRSGYCQASPANLKVGEHLEFKIKWSFIPAGKASMDIAPIQHKITGAAHHFILTASTYPVIDLIYKFREQVDSYTDAQISHSVLYKKIQKGRTKRDIKVVFDWQKKEAQYTNFKEIHKPISIPNGTLDVLSAFYFIRSQKLTVGQTIERPITDGQKIVIGRVHVLKREKIKINGHLIDTYKLEPELKGVKGVFEKSKHAKMYIWVTADNRKILVRLKSKVIVGSFIANLVNLDQL